MGTAPFTYNVLRSTVWGGPYTTIATGITVLTYTDTAVVKGTKYYYVTSATNCAGTSANSAQAYTLRRSK
jgi:cellulose 1,4-beta-cellobiosidase